MRIVLLLLVLSATVKTVAQDRNLHIQFAPRFANKQVSFDDTWYHLPGGDSVLFETFKCYLSKLILYMDEVPVYTEKNSYHLLDASDTASMSISIKLSKSLKFNKIEFNIGIDSITNTSGAMGGDLDPTRGMYWAWQSGYINLKLEGKSNLCHTRGREFSFHLGGYKAPNLAMQSVKAEVKDQDDITILIQFDQFLNATDLAKQNSVMIPGAEAVELSKRMAACIQTKKD